MSDRLLSLLSAVASTSRQGRLLAQVRDRLSNWSDEIEAVLVVVVALGAGLAAAYGREIQAGRNPARSWWIARLLLLPILAIGAGAASEAFSMSRNATAFTAAMLSMGGYDCLRFLEAYWRTRVGGLGSLQDQSGERAPAEH